MINNIIYLYRIKGDFSREDSTHGNSKSRAIIGEMLLDDAPPRRIGRARLRYGDAAEK